MNQHLGDLLRDIADPIQEIEFAERTWAGAQARRLKYRRRAIALVAAAAALVIASGVYLISSERGGRALPSKPTGSATTTAVGLLPDGTPYVVVPEADAIAQLPWRDVGLPEVIDATKTPKSWRTRVDLAGWDDPDVAAFLAPDGTGGYTPILVTRRGGLTAIDEVTVTPLVDGQGRAVSPLGARAFSVGGSKLAFAQPGKVIVVEGRGPDANVQEIPIPADDLESVGWVSTGDAERVMIARSATRAWRIEQVPNRTAYTVAAIDPAGYPGGYRFEHAPSGTGILRRFTQGDPGAGSPARNPMSAYWLETLSSGTGVATAGVLAADQTTALPANVSDQAILAMNLGPRSLPALAVLAGDRLRTDGCCQVLAWADPSTVLFLVASDDGPWLVAWDIESGRFSRASRLYAPAIDRPVLALDTGQRR